MLRLWSEGKRTGEVFQTALGVTPAEEDRRFAALLDNVLARYPKQFVPNTRAPALPAAFDAVEREPKNARKHSVLALALLRAGKPDDARQALDAALKLDPKLADARYLSARLSLAREKPADAASVLRGMLADGSDGYEVQMLLAEAAAGTGDPVTRVTALQAAARLDPTQSAPLYALLRLAEEQSDADGALTLLRKLALLSEHDAGIYRELLLRLVARKEFAEAVRVGESAVNVDVNGFESHFAFAEALAGTGDKRRAIFEYESALLCPAEPMRMLEAKSRLKALGVQR
jgi:tetratricopeptide (TPR) repeat protein